MKLENNELFKQSKVENILGNKLEEKSTVISGANAGFIIDLLTSKNYKNPIGSLVRELVSNAYDSHIEAECPKKPIVVYLNYVDGEGNVNKISGVFKVVDFGVGISPERIESIYLVIGESTKRESNDLIGAFGIGSKSPFAYTDEFEIMTRYNGIEYYYIYSKEGYNFKLRLVYSDETDKENGTEIIIKIKNHYDIDKFKYAIREELKFFPNVYYEGIIKDFNNYNIIEYKTFKYCNYKDHVAIDKLYVCMGVANYPIDFNYINKEYQDYLKLPCSIKMNIGDIDITHSREEIQYTQRSIDTIHKYLQVFIKEIMTLFGKTDTNKTLFTDDIIVYANNKSNKIETVINIKDSGNESNITVPFKLNKIIKGNYVYTYKHKDHIFNTEYFRKDEGIWRRLLGLIYIPEIIYIDRAKKAQNTKYYRRRVSDYKNIIIDRKNPTKLVDYYLDSFVCVKKRKLKEIKKLIDIKNISIYELLEIIDAVDILFNVTKYKDILVPEEFVEIYRNNISIKKEKRTVKLEDIKPTDTLGLIYHSSILAKSTNSRNVTVKDFINYRGIIVYNFHGEKEIADGVNEMLARKYYKNRHSYYSDSTVKPLFNEDSIGYKNRQEEEGSKNFQSPFLVIRLTSDLFRKLQLKNNDHAIYVKDFMNKNNPLFVRLITAYKLTQDKRLLNLCSDNNNLIIETFISTEIGKDVDLIRNFLDENSVANAPINTKFFQAAFEYAEKTNCYDKDIMYLYNKILDYFAGVIITPVNDSFTLFNYINIIDILRYNKKKVKYFWYQYGVLDLCKKYLQDTYNKGMSIYTNRSRTNEIDINTLTDYLNTIINTNKILTENELEIKISKREENTSENKERTKEEESDKEESECYV